MLWPSFAKSWVAIESRRGEMQSSAFWWKERGLLSSRHGDTCYMTKDFRQSVKIQ